jgi:hypothetical protein
MKYRVGSFVIKWSKDAVTWATTGDVRFVNTSGDSTYRMQY